MVERVVSDYPVGALLRLAGSPMRTRPQPVASTTPYHGEQVAEASLDPRGGGFGIEREARDPMGNLRAEHEAAGHRGWVRSLCLARESARR